MTQQVYDSIKSMQGNYLGQLLLPFQTQKHKFKKKTQGLNTSRNRMNFHFPRGNKKKILVKS
jgi:hypothetical protein